MSDAHPDLPRATTRSAEILGHILRSWSVFHQDGTCPWAFWEVGDCQVLHGDLLSLALGSLVPQQDCYCGNLTRSYCNNVFGQGARANLTIQKRKVFVTNRSCILKIHLSKDLLVLFSKHDRYVQALLASQIGANKEHSY